MGILRAALGLAKSLLSGRDLALENLALRQQLAVLQRSTPRPKLRVEDRLFWLAMTRWKGWKETLCLVKPETVIGWHRAGFRLFWRWRSGKGGRPPVDGEVQALIRRLATENQ